MKIAIQLIFLGLIFCLLSVPASARTFSEETSKKKNRHLPVNMRYLPGTRISVPEGSPGLPQKPATRAREAAGSPAKVNRARIAPPTGPIKPAAKVTAPVKRPRVSRPKGRPGPLVMPLPARTVPAFTPPAVLPNQKHIRPGADEAKKGVAPVTVPLKPGSAPEQKIGAAALKAVPPETGEAAVPETKAPAAPVEPPKAMISPRPEVPVGQTVPPVMMRPGDGEEKSVPPVNEQSLDKSAVEKKPEASTIKDSRPRADRGVTPEAEVSATPTEAASGGDAARNELPGAEAPADSNQDVANPAIAKPEAEISAPPADLAIKDDPEGIVVEIIESDDSEGVSKTRNQD